MFFLLALLFLIEASTPYARLAGVEIGRGESGFALQNILSFSSRILTFMFMPLIGYIVDHSLLINKEYLVYLVPVITIFLIVLLLVFRNTVMSIYVSLCRSIVEDGSVFSFYKYFGVSSIYIGGYSKTKSKRVFCYFNKYLLLIAIIYIPYYSCWPVIVTLANEFPEYRATIISSSALLNGFSTMFMTLVIDPKLTQVMSRRRITTYLYDLTIKARLVALIMSFGFIYLFSAFIS